MFAILLNSGISNIVVVLLIYCYRLFVVCNQSDICSVIYELELRRADVNNLNLSCVVVDFDFRLVAYFVKILSLER
jgi:hypothetical protein